MAAEMRIWIGSRSSLEEPSATKFGFEEAGAPASGILVLHEGRLAAFRNRCRHQPWPLDRGDGQFFDRERRFLLCRTHGAAYAPLSGECVMGPGAGLALEPLPIATEGDDIWLELEP